MIYLNLILITIITVIVIDISGIVDDAKLLLSKWITKDKISKYDYRLKPFDCSFCMNFWISLTYILIIGQFSLILLAFILLLSVMTPVIKETIMLTKDLLLKLINFIYDKVID